MEQKKFNPEISFYYQIRNAEKTKNSFFIEDAILNKKLYYLCKDLTIEQWRNIRQGDYYEKRDKLQYAEQKKFIIERILMYQ